jgi:PTS system nitrogen regulatory IIA component
LSAPPGTVAGLLDATRPGLVFPGLAGVDGASVLADLSRRVAAELPVGTPAAEIARRFAEREALGSTALGRGLAVPHCKLAGLDRPWLVVGVHPEGVDFGAPDGEPVRVFLAVVSPPAAPAAHLKVLAAISRWARDPAKIEALAAAATVDDALARLATGTGA